MSIEVNTLIKYPRTPHLPFSMGATSDDKWISKEALTYLKSGVELTVTEKMDGGGLTMSRDNFYARSLDSGTQPWDIPAKALWGSLRNEIPHGWRLSGESVYARRSVAYSALPGVYMLFGIWDETNTLLDWDSTEQWAELLELPLVPVLYRGTDFEAAISAWRNSGLDDTISEGYVLRDAGAIAYEDFHKRIVKFVRAGHVRTDASWRHRDDFALNEFVRSFS